MSTGKVQHQSRWIDNATISGLRYNILERQKDGKPCKVSPTVLSRILDEIEIRRDPDKANHVQA